MRFTKHTKSKKGGTKIKITKKKYARKSNWSLGLNDVSTENTEKINQLLRKNKSHRVESRGSWKLMPKDSCEVYRERRKRQLERESQGDDGSMSEDSQERDKTRPKESEKRDKKRAARRRIKRRRHSDSSTHSCCCSECTSCSNDSDME